MANPRREKNAEKPEKKQRNVGPEWIKTGIPGFDELLAKGIPRGANILIAGGPGTGKTIFCLQTLYNLALRGHTCLYVTFEESPERLESHMREFGWDVEAVKRTGSFTIKRTDPFRIARSVEALLAEATGKLSIEIKEV
jgi:circadian clock protein KaiC